jgi:hypothetical protein
MTILCSLQLNGHTHFKDDDSYVPESSYALSRRIFWYSSPLINSGTVSHSGHHARPPFCSFRSVSSPVTHLCVIRDFRLSFEYVTQHLLEAISRYLQSPTLLVHSVFTSIYLSSSTQPHYYCKVYKYFIQYTILIIITIDFRRLWISILKCTNDPKLQISARSIRLSHHYTSGYKISPVFLFKRHCYNVDWVNDVPLRTSSEMLVRLTHRDE